MTARSYCSYRCWGSLLTSFLAAATACQKPVQVEYRRAQARKDYACPLPPGELALRRIAPQEFPDFAEGFHNRSRVADAVRHSLAYLAKPSSRRYFPYGDVTHARAVESLNEFLHTLSEARSPAELDALIRERFDVYQSVGYDGRGTVYFTGYYTPVFDGRKRRDARFRYPLYDLPPDLVKDEEGRILGRRTPEGDLVPYFTRREIEEQGLLDGREIAWLEHPFEAYVANVQGSVKLRQEDGSLLELGYAGNNGYEYTSVAHLMIDDGAINRDDLSLQTMIRYFADNPDQTARYCRRNDRFVFFKEVPGGPLGSLNTPVTPYRSLATDKQIYPRACLAFVDTRIPVHDAGRIEQRSYKSFSLDQDTGGAIRAAGRCDLYMGVGPQAEALAGRAVAEGRLYYLFVKSETEDS